MPDLSVCCNACWRSSHLWRCFLQGLVMQPRWSLLCSTSTTLLCWPGPSSSCPTASPGICHGLPATTLGTQVRGAIYHMMCLLHIVHWQVTLQKDQFNYKVVGFFLRFYRAFTVHNARVFFNAVITWLQEIWLIKIDTLTHHLAALLHYNLALSFFCFVYS